MSRVFFVQLPAGRMRGRQQLCLRAPDGQLD